MRLKYYNILGLPNGADERRIRKAYRKLAMRYHPDKNPTEAGRKKFLEITEAYEILTEKRPLPKQRIRTSDRKSMSKEEVKQEREDRINNAKKRYEAQKNKEKQKTERYFQSLVSPKRKKAMRILSFSALIVSICLVFDLFLPRHQSEESVWLLPLETARSFNGTLVSKVINPTGTSYWVESQHLHFYRKHPDFIVERSWIFHHPIRLVSTYDTKHTFPIYYTFYKNFGTAIFLMSFSWLYWIYQKRTPYFTIIANGGYYITGIFLLYFLLVNHRWVHLLSFGFF